MTWVSSVPKPSRILQTKTSYRFHMSCGQKKISQWYRRIEVLAIEVRESSRNICYCFLRNANITFRILKEDKYDKFCKHRVLENILRCIYLYWNLCPCICFAHISRTNSYTASNNLYICHILVSEFNIGKKLIFFSIWYLKYKETKNI